MSLSSITAVLSIFPAVQTLSQTYCLGIPAFSSWIIVVIVALVGSRIDPEVKRAVVTVLLYLYWRNIHLLLVSLVEFAEIRASTVESIKNVLSIHFDVRGNFGDLPDRPTLFICNYARDRFENLFPLFIPRKIVYMMSGAFSDASGFDAAIPTLVVPEKGGFEQVRDKVAEIVRGGVNVLCYCQKPLFFGDENYGQFRTGMFRIARAAGIPLTPVRIDPIETSLSAIFFQEIRIHVGPTVQLTDDADIPQAILSFKKFLK